MEKKNYRSLVVDDEIEYQRVFSYLLKRNGYDVVTASGAREALDLLESNEINLIMTDLKMPWAAEELKLRPETKVRR